MKKKTIPLLTLTASLLLTGCSTLVDSLSGPSTETSQEQSTEPSVTPSVEPSVTPSVLPSVTPSVAPSVTPSTEQSVDQSQESPSFIPSITPSEAASLEPVTPSVEPSVTPSVSPSVTPSVSPSFSPSIAPSQVPSEDVLPDIDHVKVFCPSDWTHLYAWTDKGTVLGAWPGSSTALKSYSTGWKTYDFTGYTNINFIFNKGNGGAQTSDLVADKAGYYWYTNDGSLYCQNYDPIKYPDSQGGGSYEADGFTIVNSAKDYTELPAMNNFAANSIKSKYEGTRTDFRDESIYFAMTTRFYDGDSSNNVHCWDGLSKGYNKNDPEWRGDFKGLIQKMDYIKAQGFTAIWITPVVKNASGYDYHGYHAINFSEVDPRYESEDCKFQDVINAAHSRGMKIVLDVVFNHSGNFGEENLFPMFSYDPGTDASINGIKRNENGILTKAYDNKNGNAQYDERIMSMKGAKDKYNIYHHEQSFGYEQYIEQTGQMAGDCVDLNTENPTVANYLVDCYGKFIQMGVDAFRIDTMKHISRYTLNKYYFPAFTAIAKKVGNPYFHMFGEVCSRWSESVWNHNNPNCSAPFYSWSENKSYNWGDRATNEATTKTFYEANNNTGTQPSSTNHKLNGMNYHSPDKSRFNGNSVIDFQMHWNFDNAGGAYSIAKGWDHTYQDATYNVVYVDSHDYGPQNQEKYRYKGGTAAWKENMDLMFTFRGIPCIYYGSEVEFKKGEVIDLGPNIDLEDTGRAYFGNRIEGNVTATDFGSYKNASGNVASALTSPLSVHLQKLNKARLSCIALRRGQYNTDNYNGSGFGYIRRYTANGKDSIAAVCFSGSGTFSGLPSGTYKDLYGGGTKTVSGGTLTASASGQGNIQIWVLEK